MSDTHPEIVRTLEAYTKSIAVYYASEKAFLADPTMHTAHAYHTAADRLLALRDEVRHASRFGDALLGTEKDGTVGR